MGLVRGMLKEKSLPIELWGEAVSTCVCVLNRSSTKGIKGATPFEKWNGRKPNVSYLKVFGSIVFVKITGRLSKLEGIIKCMVFLGYESRSKAYRCLDPITFKIHISRDVIFVETKCYEFSEQSKMRKISSYHSNTLHVTRLEEPAREQIEESREELVTGQTRERDLNQSEEFEGEETLKFRSMQSSYDETNLMCSESSLLSAEEPSSYSLAAKKCVERCNARRNLSNSKEQDLD